MFEESKFEYVVKICPVDDAEALQSLLNEMSEEGRELYSLHEVEGDDGFVYNCIFSKPVGNSYEENDDIIDAGDFKSRMEKLFKHKDEPYEKAKSLLKQYREKNERINTIKQLLDSDSPDTDRESINKEISEKLAERNVLKNKFTEILSPSGMYAGIGGDILTVTVGEELADLIDVDKNGELLTESVRLRQELTDRYGYVIPAIKFVGSEKTSENQYILSVREFKALSCIAYSEHKMFYQGQANMDKKPAGAIESIDPVTGQKVFWIAEEKTKDFWEKGITASQAIIVHLEFVVMKYIDEILSYDDILNYINALGEENIFLAEELLQGAFSLGDLRYILVRLIREKVSVKDIIFVFEKLNDLMQYNGNIDEIVDKLRILLGRQICSVIADYDNIIYGIIPSSEQSEKLKKALTDKNKINKFIQNNDVKAFVESVKEKLENCDCDISNIAVITKPELRRPVFYLLEHILPELRVLSEAEIPEEFTLEAV